MTPLLDAWVEAAAWTWVLLVARLGPLVLLLPVFGGLRAAPSVRGGVLALLCAATWPGVVTPPDAPAAAVAIAAGQLAVGLVSAIGAMAVFEAARVAGALADISLGRGSFGASDPMSGQGAGPLETLHALGVAAVFCGVGGPTLLLGAFADGLVGFPLDAPVTAGVGVGLVDAAVRATGAALSVGVAAALPFLVAAMLVDLSLGWFGRALPSVQAMFLAMPTRALVGWCTLAATLAATIRFLAEGVPAGFAGGVP